MHFPFSYTGELVIYKPEDFNSNTLLKQFENEAIISEIKGDTIYFSAPVSFSKLPVKIKLTITDDNTSVHFSYQISLFENNIAFISAIVFGIFFWHFDESLFATIAIILGVIYYLFNTARISKSIKKTIVDSMGGNTDVGKPELWKKQQNWMKDTNLCPACGEPKNPYASKCVNCGLFLHKKGKKISNTNTSTQNYNEIIYDISKKKK